MVSVSLSRHLLVIFFYVSVNQFVRCQSKLPMMRLFNCPIFNYKVYFLDVISRVSHAICKKKSLKLRPYVSWLIVHAANRVKAIQQNTFSFRLNTLRIDKQLCIFSRSGKVTQLAVTTTWKDGILCSYLSSWTCILFSKIRKVCLFKLFIFKSTVQLRRKKCPFNKGSRKWSVQF